MRMSPRAAAIAFAVDTFNVPVFTLVVPVYALVPLNVSTAAPDLIRFPAVPPKPITPEKVVLVPSLTVSVLVPIITLPPPLRSFTVWFAVMDRAGIATALAGILTYFVVKWTNDPTIAFSLAFASITAFAVSEMTDWAVYSFTKWPLQQRILWSSLASVPLDTVIFQNLAGYYTPAAFITELASKAIGVGIVWYLLKLRVGNASVALPGH